MIGQSPKQGQAPTVVSTYNAPVTEDAQTSNVQTGGPFKEDITYVGFMLIDGVVIKLESVVAAVPHEDGGCAVYMAGLDGRFVHLKEHTVEQFFEAIQ